MNEYVKRSLTTLEKIIAIKSVKGDAMSNSPFGKETADCLREFLSDAERLGFKTINYDNYVGEVVFGDGNDEDGLAILAHLDVVPEGDLKAWNYPPYKLSFDGEFLYGRGVIDDKGPATVCLYAMKSLKDEGFKPNRKIKLILGLDEESGWGCMDYYEKVATFPREGFTPDGDFPVIYAEKGIYHIRYEFNVGANVIDIFGGDRVNMVCDKASVSLKNFENHTEKAAKFNGKKIDGGYEFYGVTAHGSTPDKGVNAIKFALAFLVEINEFSKIDFDNLFNDGACLSEINDETGNLTFSPNVISYSNGKIYLQTDVRYPSTIDFNHINNRLLKVGKFTEIRHQLPLYNDKNGKLVKTLLGVFNEKTGRTDGAIAIGGGTYARALKNGVAFGASFDEAAHVPNEKQSLKNYELCFDIYKEAIKRLTK